MNNPVVNVSCNLCGKIITGGKFLADGDKTVCLPCTRKLENPPSVDVIQDELKKWTLRNFDQEYPDDRLVVGSYFMSKLQWHHMKSMRVYGEGDPKEVLEEKKRCIGDVALALITYSTDNHLNFFDVLCDRWKEVRELDYVQFPISGKPDHDHRGRDNHAIDTAPVRGIRQKEDPCKGT